MAEGWGDFFVRLGKATVAGLEMVGKVTSQVVVAFDANEQRGSGILWLPRTDQILHYTIRWSNKLNLRGKSEVEIQLINVLLGLSMWSGLINANRMVREPVIKIGRNIENGMRKLEYDEDAKSIWETVKQVMNGIFRTTSTEDEDEIQYNWEYVIGYEKLSKDSEFKQVKRLSSGQMLIPSSPGLGFYSLVDWNPMPFFGLIVGIIAESYRK